MEQQTFNINKIISHYKLDVNEVDEVLFPHVRYKTLALNRILNGEAYLDTQQIEKLAEYIGVFVHELFTFDEWKGTYEDGSITWAQGEYKVKLHYNGTFLTMYKGTKAIYQELESPKNTTVEEFISHINLLTKKFKQNGSN